LIGGRALHFYVDASNDTNQDFAADNSAREGKMDAKEIIERIYRQTRRRLISQTPQAEDLLEEAKGRVSALIEAGQGVPLRMFSLAQPES
jgi:hypothetical protein